MSDFDKTKIEVLFSMALAKARVERNRTGFRTLSEKINESKDLKSPGIELKYLDESVHKKLIISSQKRHSSVGLHRDYVEVLVKYVGYESFQNFEAIWNNMNHVTEPNTYKPLRLICEQGLEEELEEYIKQMRHPGQATGLKISRQSITEVSDLEDSIDNTGVETMYYTLITSDTWLTKQPLDELNKLIKRGRLLPIIFKREEGKTETSVSAFSRLDLYLFGQRLICLEGKKGLDEPQFKKSLSSTRKTVNISDSGAINLGHIGSIKGKYISSRDMHITIKKRRK
ncbi:MAG: hypothetical protein HEP71_33410 [Roseivirga sp.]|nr:hypothetical protein [Roseivirga sp.]